MTLNPAYVKWIDAMSDQGGWRTVEESIEWGETVPVEISQLGYIIEENENYLLLADKVNYDIVSGLTRIPKKYIIELKELLDRAFENSK